MTTYTDNPWNSLEVVKLVVEFLTPIFIVFIGMYISKILKKIEQMQWRNQKLVEKRLEIYDSLAPLLNDLLCYYNYVGNWKDVKPPDMINYKRTIDKKIYLAAPLFSKAFFSECMCFVNLCFETFTGWGNDAKLRTKFERRKSSHGVNWDDSWNNLFSNESQVASPQEIRECYQRIMKAFSEDIGLNDYNDHGTPTGRIPANIR